MRMDPYQTANATHPGVPLGLEEQRRLHHHPAMALSKLELTSGQPFKEGDQDKLDELLTITDEELEFWNKIGVSPTYMFEDYGIDDEFSYDIKTQRTVVQ